MVDVGTIIDGLLQRGIVLTLEGDDHVAADPISELTDGDLATLWPRRAEITAYLRESATSATANHPQRTLDDHGLIADRAPGVEGQGVARSEKVAAPLVATVSVTRVADSPPKHRRGFVVDLNGEVCCGKCQSRGQVPHHLSLIFWTFWSREQVAALLQRMHPDENLAWLACRLVRLAAPDGTERYLREQDGEWCAETSESEYSK